MQRHHDVLHRPADEEKPSAAYQVPVWLSDTIRRLLDEYEAGGRELPYYEHALMVIDERSDIEGRRVFDQDNTGFKAASNAVKGRLVPDDDQYTLSVALLAELTQPEYEPRLQRQQCGRNRQERLCDRWPAKIL